MFSIGMAAFAALTIWALLERAREAEAARRDRSDARHEGGDAR